MLGWEAGATAPNPTQSTLAGMPRIIGSAGAPRTPPAPGKRPTTRPALPSASSVDYAHKLGQAGVLWAGIAIFAVYALRSGNPAGMLRGLVRKHVAA